MTGQKDLDAWLDEFAPAMADGSQGPAAPVEESFIQGASWLDEPVAAPAAPAAHEDYTVPPLELTPADLGDDSPAALGNWPEPDGPIPGWDVSTPAGSWSAIQSNQPQQPETPSVWPPTSVQPAQPLAVQGYENAVDPYNVQPVAPDPYARQDPYPAPVPTAAPQAYVDPMMQPVHQPQQAIGFQPPADTYGQAAPVPGFEYEPASVATPGTIGFGSVGTNEQLPVGGVPPAHWNNGDGVLGAPEPAAGGLLDSLSDNPAGRFVLEWLPILLGAAIVALLVRAFIFQAYFIPSGSMIPTLAKNDRVLVNKLSYDFHDVNRGDVVVFGRPANEDPTGIPDLIKRIIALPGETVQLRNGDVYVDGALVRESYLVEQVSTRPLRNDAIPGCIDADPINCTVPEGYVFVMGDNRAGSRDSREFGPIPIDSIVGRSFVKVWPLTNLGLL